MKEEGEEVGWEVELEPKVEGLHIYKDMALNIGVLNG